MKWPGGRDGQARSPWPRPNEPSVPSSPVPRLCALCGKSFISTPRRPRPGEPVFNHRGSQSFAEVGSHQAALGACPTGGSHAKPSSSGRAAPCRWQGAAVLSASGLSPSPEVGAQGGSAARWDLCGGRRYEMKAAGKKNVPFPPLTPFACSFGITKPCIKPSPRLVNCLYPLWRLR